MKGKSTINCFILVILLISISIKSSYISNTNYNLDYDMSKEDLDQLSHLGDLIFEDEDNGDVDYDSKNDFYIIEYDENTTTEDIIKQIIEQENSKQMKRKNELIKEEKSNYYYEENELLSINPRDNNKNNLELMNHNQ